MLARVVTTENENGEATGKFTWPKCRNGFSAYACFSYEGEAHWYAGRSRKNR